MWGAVHVDETLPIIRSSAAAGSAAPSWRGAAPPQAGDGVWAKDGPHFERGAAHAPLELTRAVKEGRFGACAALPPNATGTIYLAVSARTDQAWAKTPSQPYSPSSSSTPQSHIANARGNLNWRHEANGRRVHGRGAWFSTDLVVLALRDGALVGAPRLIAPSAAPGGGPTLVEGYKKSRARTRRRLAQQWLPSAR